MRDTARQADRLAVIRLRYTINTHLEDQSLTISAPIVAEVGLFAIEAVRLLTRRREREGNLEALQAVADRLGLAARLDGLGVPPSPVDLRRSRGGSTLRHVGTLPLCGLVWGVKFCRLTGSPGR
ncbi:hypothetical protein [Belnapia rosea]|uniref:Uncharacterized protein n=1 Tax=Belnapia rosea TaxID=938405 RepID=A0A1G7ATN7_9PROT|nr:hypothetical protein [Belnapia rosea]SDE18199.1 hypothetical protein SAMN04487779_102139 [Belnapia rosea]